MDVIPRSTKKPTKYIYIYMACSCNLAVFCISLGFFSYTEFAIKCKARYIYDTKLKKDPPFTMPTSVCVYHTSTCNNLGILFKNMIRVSPQTCFCYLVQMRKTQFKQRGRRQKMEHKHLLFKASENKRPRCTKQADERIFLQKTRPSLRYIHISTCIPRRPRNSDLAQPCQ